MTTISGFFICPGAQKSGTTSLHDLLCQHPQISLPHKKETKYFIQADIVDKEDYVGKFFIEPINGLVGEIDPDYMVAPNVPKNLFKALGPDLKLIFLLRNPIDRAYSHYWMSYRRGFETESFEAAFELEAERLASGGRTAFWHQSYFSRGFYSDQINRFLDFFNIKNCLFVRFDDFVNRRAESLKEILSFLGVDDGFDFQNTDIKSNQAGLPKSRLLSTLHGRPPAFIRFFKFLVPSRKFRWTVIYPMLERLNISKEKPPQMQPETRAKLLEYYTEEMNQLENLTGIDTSAWRKA